MLMDREPRIQAGWVMLGVGAILAVIGVVMLATGDDESGEMRAVDAVEQPEPRATEPVDPEPPATNAPEPTATLVPPATPTPEPEPTATIVPTPTAVPAEDPAAFLALLAEGLRGDTEFLLSRLNQATFDRYSREQCAQALPPLADPTAELTLRDVGEPETWEYATDEVVTVIDGATPVEVSRVAASQTLIQEVHWLLVDGQWTWFTDCGDPLTAG